MRCPTPYKQRCETRVEAEQLKPRPDLAAYRCSCGGWHWKGHYRKGGR